MNYAINIKSTQSKKLHDVDAEKNEVDLSIDNKIIYVDIIGNSQ